MASKIDRGKAQSLIQEFREQNKAAGDAGLKTPEGHHLNGFFIHRETLESILKNEKVAGIHVHLAKHPDFAGKPGNIHTLMVSGSEPNTEAGAAAPYIGTGDVYASSSPCPPWCSNP